MLNRFFVMSVAIIAALLLAAALVPAQMPKQPPMKDKLRVHLRYHIPAPRDQHVLQYDEMIEHLKKLEFVFEPPLDDRPDTDREDRSKNRMKGFIAPDKVLRILQNTSIASILFYPDDLKLEEIPPDQPAYIRLELTSGLAPGRQRELFEQVRAMLSLQQFREAVGYDHRGYSGTPFSRLVGTIPAGRVDTLLKDLRGQPGGWLAPVFPSSDLPSPLRAVNPIQVIEVLREKEALKVFAEPEPRNPDYLEKISPDLWELVNQKDVPLGRIRVQVVLIGTYGDENTSWRLPLAEAVPEFFVEGFMGQFITGQVPIAQIKSLAALPAVSVIRLPRLSRVDADPALKLPGDNAKVLAQSGVSTLHTRGVKGKGVKLGIIDIDFRGWESMVKTGKLPAATRLVDLSAERDTNLVPAPYPGDPDQPGHGTLCAQAAALAAPESEIALIRTDAIAPYQLREIVRYIQGGDFSPTIEARRDELLLARAALRVRREELAKERERVLNNFDDDTEQRARLGFLGAVYGWLYNERDWHNSRIKDQAKREQEMAQRDARFDRFLALVDSLRGIQVLACPLIWSDGFPLGGLSPLSRWLDSNPATRPLWFQSVGNKRGQCWMGDFRSVAGYPAMEFAAPSALPKDRWTTELNFLAWQPHRADRQLDLPEKAQLRLTVQWREPHDPDYYIRPGEDDYYKKPLATLKLIVLRQRDPDAAMVPADVFEVAAVSAGRPQRLVYEPSGAIYEVGVELTVDKPGRYALRVEKQPNSLWIGGVDPVRKTPALAKLDGLNPIGIRPLGVPVLVGQARDWELRPRIFVETIDETVRLQGRATFADFSTEAGTVGMPADSRGVISVGAADLDGKPRPDCAVGPMPFVELSQRPTILAYDGIQLDGGTAFGSSVANAFAAGTTAALLGSGMPREQLRLWLQAHEGKVMRVPETGGR